MKKETGITPSDVVDEFAKMYSNLVWTWLLLIAVAVLALVNGMTFPDFWYMAALIAVQGVFVWFVFRDRDLGTHNWGSFTFDDNVAMVGKRLVITLVFWLVVTAVVADQDWEIREFINGQTWKDGWVDIRDWSRIWAPLGYVLNTFSYFLFLKKFWDGKDKLSEFNDQRERRIWS